MAWGEKGSALERLGGAAACYVSLHSLCFGGRLILRLTKGSFVASEPPSCYSSIDDYKDHFTEVAIDFNTGPLSLSLFI